MKSKKLAIALASTIALLSGCGSSNNNGTTPGAGNIIGYTTQCTAQGVCTQVPIYGNGGCVPISSPIYFGGSGQTNGYELVTGTPGNSSYGSLAVSTSPVNNVGGQAWTSPSGLTMYEVRTSGSAVSVSGQMVLSQAVQQSIASYGYGGYGGYGTTSSTCVSGIALDVFPTYTSVYGVTGYVYLFFNNNNSNPYPVRLY